MSATYIAAEQRRLQQSGYELVPAGVTVTNGTGRVSIVIGREGSPELSLALDTEQAQLLADALIRKAVNVSRGVHDNDKEAI